MAEMIAEGANRGKGFQRPTTNAQRPSGEIRNSNQKPTRPPIVNALQKEFGGGEFDGHIILLKNPGAR